jgi:hypothetical protein
MLLFVFCLFLLFVLLFSLTFVCMAGAASASQARAESEVARVAKGDITEVSPAVWRKYPELCSHNPKVVLMGDR